MGYEGVLSMSEEEAAPANGLRKSHIFGAAILLLILLLLIAWWQRTQIADNFIQSQLEEYDATASYNIEELSFRTQAVSNLIIGDPADPDLTIKDLEVDLQIGFSGVAVKWVRAKGVRLRGELLEDGTLKMGEVDKFLPDDSEEPFSLPDIALDLEDTVVSLATPWGGMGLDIEGLGQLQGQFAGRAALRSPRLSYQGCDLQRPSFNGDILLGSGEPKLAGPIEAQSIICKDQGVALNRPVLNAQLSLNDSFDRWIGDVGFAAQNVSFAGQNLEQPAGGLEFEGGLERTNFKVALDQASYKSDLLRIGRMVLTGDGRFGQSDNGFSLAMRGGTEIAAARLDTSAIDALDDAADSAADTPVGPLLARLAPAARKALSSFDAGARFDFAVPARAAAKIDIDAFDIASASGARIRQAGALRLEARQSGWILATPLQIAMSGGGIPEGRLALRQAGQGWSGSLTMAPYLAGDARLAINDLAFSGRPGGAWRFNGNAQLSGPLPGGRIDRLDLPLQGQWNGALLSLYDSCQQVRFDRANLSGLSLGRQTLRLCPNGGSILSAGSGGVDIAANIPAVNMSGDLGGSPFRFSSARVDFRLDDGFRASDLSIAIGESGNETAFDVASIQGRFDRQGLSGTLNGGAGQIANVPLLMSEAAGDWTYRDGLIRLLGGLNFNDAAQEERFFKMAARDIVVDYEDGTITALGDIFEPETQTRVGGVDIAHSLNSGEGRSLISVPGLNFNNSFQPELLTPLTLGVIANVAGTVYGDGRIEWDNSKDGIRSSGLFGTDNLDLAAAFGPVTGLKTQLKFTDLLNLETAPSQVANIESINPGVAALAGIVKYRLLPDQKVEIEEGRWPFADGVLSLERTVWDLAVDKPRHLVFRVKGAQIDRFLAQFDFSNLSATGSFDGVLPMVFDEKGGRIVGGELVSQGDGGNISYIGDLTYEDLSAYANFAFDALRSLDYSNLRLGLNGDLEGEIITVINFKGIKQGQGAQQNFITRQLAKIPIEFNLQVEAQFFQLITTARDFYDPEFLVQRNLPLLLEQQRKAELVVKESVNENNKKAEPAVQPVESETGL